MAHRSATASQRPPVVVAAAAVIAVLFLLLPLLGLVWRIPWGHLWHTLTQPGVAQALWLSLWTASLATLVAMLLGVPLAWVLARTEFRGRRLVQALVLLPLVLPPVVGGLALLMAFGRTGLIGRPLDALFGLTIPFTPVAVIMAQTFVAMPFLVLSVEGALRSTDSGFEEAAATLGASRFDVLRRVTLPLVAPAIAAGAVLCWARALGEFGATITFAGSLPGRTETMPVAIYYALETDPYAAVVLALALLSVCVVVLVVLRRHWLPGRVGL